MTSEEIRKKMSEKLGRPMKATIGTEYEYVIGFQVRPSEKLCIVKKTGEVFWEEELPDRLAPKGKGIIYLLPPED